MTTLLPDEAVPITYGMSVYGGNRIWSIGAKTQYPELCMAIINWLSTPEGRMTPFAPSFSKSVLLIIVPVFMS